MKRSALLRHLRRFGCHRPEKQCSIEENEKAASPENYLAEKERKKRMALEPELVAVDVSIDVTDFHFEERPSNQSRFIIEILLHNKTGKSIRHIDGVVVVYGPEEKRYKTIFLSSDENIADGESVEMRTTSGLVYRQEHEMELTEIGFTSLRFVWETRDVRFASSSL